MGEYRFSSLWSGIRDLNLLHYRCCLKQKMLSYRDLCVCDKMMNVVETLCKLA